MTWSWIGRTRKIIRPGWPDLVFGLVLAFGLIGGRHAFLGDPGTFWHAEIGRQILETGRLSWSDGLSFTRKGAPWANASWLADVVLAGVVGGLGWSGAVALTAVWLAATYGALARWLIARGQSPWASGLAALVAMGIGSVHFLARPHVFTIGLVLYTLWACREANDGRRWWPLDTLPLAVWAWANLHGGFLAGPVIVATATFGHAVSGPWDAPRRRTVARMAAIAVLCGVTPLLTPYGADLYRQDFELLVGSGLTRWIVEYQPARFGDRDTRLLEALVVALIVLPSLTGRRLSRYELCHVVVWFHLGMTSIRHAPLFAIAAAPSLARLIDGLLTRDRPPRWLRPGWSPWSVVIAAVVVALAAAGVPLGGHDPKSWPIDGLAALDARPASARLFHEQDWGGLIASESRPRRPVFLDDRFELYGPGPLVDYLKALEGGPGWDLLDARERFDLVWVRPGRGLARRLEVDPGWRAVHRDRLSVLFERARR